MSKTVLRHTLIKKISIDKKRISEIGQGYPFSWEKNLSFNNNYVGTLNSNNRYIKLVFCSFNEDCRQPMATSGFPQQIYCSIRKQATRFVLRTQNIITSPIRLDPGGSMSQVVGSSYSSYKPIINTAWVRARLCKLQKGSTGLAAVGDKVYQVLAHGRWFSPGTPASSTTKTGHHDIAEILLKVALKHQQSNQINQ